MSSVTLSTYAISVAAVLGCSSWHSPRVDLSTRRLEFLEFRCIVLGSTLVGFFFSLRLLKVFRVDVPWQLWIL
ncbi:hypothetical protein F4819DRAFT_477999 [Hypoxylon fuscum]|nr:hypothetical protein F4819DRAFT_477999 [Hypoxylon fuscum]